ncbi:Transposable element Tc1 transposase, partial [Stegodyphus mimosarum]
MGPQFLFMDDNAPPHRTVTVEELLESEDIEHMDWSASSRICQYALQGIQMLPWPPYSPNLSPIEHMWDGIGRRLQTLPLPRSEDELWQMVEREWRAIPQDTIRTLIDSMPRRVSSCIAVRGGPTSY